MGYLLKAIIGAALFIGGAVLFEVKLIDLLETGTCASGNQPFEVARECPEGIASSGLLLVAGVFASMIGGALFVLRGSPPWSSGRRSGITGTFSWAALAWGLFFTGTGAATLIASKTSETIPEDGELGGTIVAITFLAMGVPALLFALWGLFAGLGDRDERPQEATSAPGIGSLGGAAASSMSGMMRGGQGVFGQVGSPRAGRTAAAGGDAVGRLERLQRLRESGALTEPEFEREKARILAEM